MRFGAAMTHSYSQDASTNKQNGHKKESMMTHAAIGIFQGEANWSITIRVAGFGSKSDAEHYAGNFRITLRDGRLYRDHADGCAREDRPWIEVPDEDVSLSRLKPAAGNRIAQAHRKYLDQGLGQFAIALQSIKEFEESGHSDLVISEDDYEPVNLPIAQWHQEDGLTCGFDGVSYSVE